MTSPVSSDLLRGHTDTILLGLLAEGDKYGYELSKLIYERSGERYELKEATMYSSLRRLESLEFISAYWGEESQGGRRKYYHISAAGRRMHKQLIDEWARAREILDTLM